MLGIALNLGGAAIFDGDQDAAGVGTVVGTGGVDDGLHLQIIRSIHGCIVESRMNIVRSQIPVENRNKDRRRSARLRWQG
jgi:hypothetical protein